MPGESSIPNLVTLFCLTQGSLLIIIVSSGKGELLLIP